MYRSRTITVAIARPLERVYAFLADPRNLSRWGSGPRENFREIGPLEWETVGQGGVLRIRVTPKNRFGVLDFSMSPVGQQALAIPARVYANGDGSEFAVTMFQYDGISDERFASDCEWLQADLLVLKTYLESL
jgi:hypothetical protein